MNTALVNIKVSNNNRSETIHGIGGGILVQGSTLKMFQSKFYNNYAVRAGGLIYATNNTSLLICDSYFENNTAGLFGGALYIHNQSHLTINESSLVE